MSASTKGFLTATGGGATLLAAVLVGGYVVASAWATSWAEPYATLIKTAQAHSDVYQPPGGLDLDDGTILYPGAVSRVR
jgi:hypothetical protein